MRGKRPNMLVVDSLKKGGSGYSVIEREKLITYLKDFPFLREKIIEFNLCYDNVRKIADNERI